MLENPPVNTPEQEVTSKPENRLIAWIKGLFTFIVLLVIVVASFWVSFQLGKRILVPVKRLPENRIQAVIPEPPPSIKALQQLEKAMSKDTKAPPPAPKPVMVKSKEPATDLPVSQIAEKKLAQMISADNSPKPVTTRTIVAPAITQPTLKKIEVKKSVIKKIVKAPPSGYYYKVQAGEYASKAQAQAVAVKVQAQRFDYFIKKVPAGWRVQVGAFRTQNEAAQLKASLAAAGFEAQIIKE